MSDFVHKTLHLVILLVATLLVSCQPKPQRAKHLTEKQPIDSLLMLQLQFNTHMADAADRECIAFVQSDSLNYTMDAYGFWYCKTAKYQMETVETGQKITLHIQINELNGPLLSDVKYEHIVGSGELPLALSRSIKMMATREQMRIVAPWYTAYGIEGTDIIKPYTNLLINIRIE